MKLDDARKYALSLAGTTEEPHFKFSSFRVGGKIFATCPPDGEFLHVFVGEEERAPLIAAEPAAYEPLHWGAKVVGIRIRLAKANAKVVKALLQSSWSKRATPLKRSRA